MSKDEKNKFRQSIAIPKKNLISLHKSLPINNLVRFYATN